MNNQPLIYEDFVVEATGLKEDGSFQVRVLSSPLGGMTSASAVRVGYNSNLFIIYKHIQNRLIGELENSKLIRFGRLLADLLLPEGWGLFGNWLGTRATARDCPYI